MYFVSTFLWHRGSNSLSGQEASPKSNRGWCIQKARAPDVYIAARMQGSQIGGNLCKELLQTGVSNFRDPIQVGFKGAGLPILTQISSGALFWAFPLFTCLEV